MSDANNSDHRPTCYACFRPQNHCICRFVEPVHNETGIRILQHPAEHNHPFGTARIAKLALSNVKLDIAWPGFALNTTIEQNIPASTGILYPSAEAQNLAECSVDERPKNLILLDGTWNTARSIYKSYPKLRQLPHYKLVPKLPSAYRIRKAPKAEHRSTIEAVWQALTILEPGNTELVRLLTAFEKMVSQQIKYRKVHPPGPRIRKGEKPPRKPLPLAFRDHFENLIVGYGEFYREPNTSNPHELYYWTAHRPATNESFAVGIRPADNAIFRPSAEAIEWMGLEPEMVFQGASRAAFKEAWHNFAGDNYILGTWNHITGRLFAGFMPCQNAGVHLKQVYCSVIGGSCGGLADVCKSQNRTAPMLPVQGRAQERLSQAVAMTHWLRRRAIDCVQQSCHQI